MGDWQGAREHSLCQVAYYLGEHVQTLSAKMKPIMIGTHSLNCELVLTGRAPLHRELAAPEQWEATIGGNKLPQLTGEAWTEYQAMKKKKWSERVQPQMEAMAAAVILYDLMPAPRTCRTACGLLSLNS